VKVASEEDEDEVADDDDTYIDPNQRSSRTVGSVGGGGALGRGEGLTIILNKQCL